jgi:6-pyruvoyltetrahydropterin/6-carboxytetrahydropterin synthase
MGVSGAASNRCDAVGRRYSSVHLDAPHGRRVSAYRSNVCGVKTSVIRRYRFEAAHYLEWHPGKCRRLHGHSYTLEVAVQGRLDSRGVVLDFAELDAMVDLTVDALDHSLLNETLDNPTAERLAHHIGESLNAQSVAWTSIRLWETNDGSVLIEQ